MRPSKVAMLVVFLGLVAGVAPKVAAAGDPPVAYLMQVTGTVEDSHDGANWRPVTRNKNLFAGDWVRTGADGSAKIVDPTNNAAQVMAGNTKIEVVPGSYKTVEGKLSASEQIAGDMGAGLANRFAEAQRYTTVRRGVSTESAKLRVARQVTLSASYPDLVWQNLGKQYSYALTIDGAKQEVASTDAEMVRVKLGALAPGSHMFAVATLDGGKEVGDAGKGGTIVWLSADEDKALAETVAKVKSTIPNDPFAVASVLDEKGLSVAAMDLYRKHFAEDKDDNSMRPLLIRVYYDLGLADLKQKEALLYNEMASTN